MKKQPKIRLYIRGNCGNQFFQYAFARNIQEMYGGELIINYYRVAHDVNAWPGSDNLLAQFNTVNYTYNKSFDVGIFLFKLLRVIRIVFRLDDYQKRTYRFYLWCAKYLPKFGVYFFDAAYYPFSFYRRRNYYICGYFESPQYFEEIDDKICKELEPKESISKRNEDILDRIRNRNSICVTIKRNNVNNAKIADIYWYEMSYFYNAIEYVCSKVDNPLVCIFADDTEWCRKNMKIEHDVWFESDNNSIWEKIRLMSACKHFIIHNSTFSWWIQHLSPNKERIVIAPSKWMIRDDQPIDIYEKGWLFLKVDGSITDKHE